MQDRPSDLDIIDHNRQAWDRQASQGCAWSRPVTPELIAAARAGQWQARLTPGDLPKGWLPDIRGRKILCLASAGGQQAPILAAAGAEVTVFDLSERQLDQDRLVAEREDLPLTIVQGDMRDLSIFPDDSFDIIFHPISNLYVPDIQPVWRECHRVLRMGGLLLASFYNPVVFVGDRDPRYAEQGLIRPAYRLPFVEAEHLAPNLVRSKVERGEALVFGHSLVAQIDGQMRAGFMLAGFHEDWQPAPRFLIDSFVPTFIATCAIKGDLGL
ncbi:MULTISPECIES: class I SAM-dependent methyltransferase [unclassified Ensifer]|uniref:class I SAM-dependent methyltransferase n=1 Tax=unclassified Ensifer TaxID=2633371 RepID=UPI0008132298|nr:MULTISPECIES: class I SAM-dependent methyltransferase [unclassified Ensifer]OCP00870.1 methyltransferase [Ensifer sp. LC11]OCP01438.1 methyltransferase [Ensifer sp. LC13]OCP01986.1 methyltransferase [Ensifer sp. LC14]OCP30182.1 methyltransferase [Ensifer sp. LC499]